MLQFVTILPFSVEVERGRGKQGRVGMVSISTSWWPDSRRRRGQVCGRSSCGSARRWVHTWSSMQALAQIAGLLCLARISSLYCYKISPRHKKVKAYLCRLCGCLQCSLRNGRGLETNVQTLDQTDPLFMLCVCEHLTLIWNITSGYQFACGDWAERAG